MRALPLPLVIASVALFLALIPGLPYGYFQLLRFLICGVSCYGAFMAMEREKKPWMWLFVCLAVLFNPIIKVHFDRDVWQVIDAAAGLFLGIATVQFREGHTPSSTAVRPPF
jgi:uncharacterized membrane protein YccC